jgi:hypothetical protein
MKTCGKCGDPKPNDEFALQNKKTGQRASYCRGCRRIYGRVHYSKNKELYIDRNERAHARLLEFLHSLKRGPCMDCGGTFHPCAMDFDHRDSKEKVSNVSELFSRVSRRKLLEEVAKCDLVCANCHRVRTWNRRQ